MAEQNSASKNGTSKRILSVLVLVGLLLIVLGGIYYASSMSRLNDEPQVALDETSDIETAVAPTEENAAAEVETDAAPEDAAMTNVAPEDLAVLAQERILGDPTAPIKITEHASLTCSHCAHFHDHTLPEFKEKYIDTGRAYLVYSDFPLNAPALHASMVARCVPEDRFFEFIGALFAEQGNWAGDVGYITYLKNKAAEYGVSESRFQTCIKAENLQNALIQKMQAVQQQWSVNSTPSFVVNNQIVISGALGYEDLDKRIQDGLAQLNAESQAAPASEDASVVETPDTETEGAADTDVSAEPTEQEAPASDAAPTEGE